MHGDLLLHACSVACGITHDGTVFGRCCMRQHIQELNPGMDSLVPELYKLIAICMVASRLHAYLTHR